MSNHCNVDVIVDLKAFTKLERAKLMECVIEPMLAKLQHVFEAGPHDSFVTLRISAVGRTEDELGMIYHYPEAE